MVESQMVAVEQLKENRLPDYVSPRVATYTSEEILEIIGPANTCSPTVCGAIT